MGGCLLGMRGCDQFWDIFTKSAAASAFLNSLPGMKRGRMLVTCLPRMPCAGAGAHFVHLRAVRAVAQPEAAEIAQLDDIAISQLLRNDLQHRFQHGHGIRTGDGAHLRDALRQLAQAFASAGLDGGVELPGRFPVLRVGALDHNTTSSKRN